MKLLKLLSCLALFALVAGAQNARSLCIFLDLRSMSPTDQLIAQESAIKYVQESTKPSDVIAIMTFTSDLKMIQDFSSDHDVLIAALRKIVPYTATPANPADANSSLRAIQDAAKILEPVPGKKQLIYFSNGVRTADNQDQLKAAVDAAVRANLSIYPMDFRAAAVAPQH